MASDREFDPFRNWAKAINSILRTSQELSSSVADHGGVIGESREFFMREILSRFLPKSVEVGTGQIVDCNNKLSKQVDIVISHPEFPVLTLLATSNIFFADSVIATIEVKSELSGSVDGNLWEALDNCQSVKQLQLTDPSLFGEGKPAFWKFIRRLPSTYIFGYRGYKKDLSSLKKAIYTWVEVRKPSPVELPNVIVTDGCVVITNYGISEAFDSNSLRRTLGHDCVFVAREDPEALTWLLIHLLGYVGGIHTSAGGNTYARYAWGVNFAVNAFREREWQTWGRWVYDETTQIPPHFDLSDSFDSTFPQK